MTQRYLTLTAIGALVATMAVTGCSRRDQQEARDATNSTVATVEQKARDLGQDAKDATQNMTQDVKEASRNASAKVSDAMITTGVKAELAKDSNLSALKINVETDAGKVSLKGSAPSTSARDHATTLAQGVKGVVKVDNQLVVDRKS